MKFEEIAIKLVEKAVELAVFRDSEIANEARFLRKFCSDSEEWLDDVINYIYRSGDVFADQLMRISKSFAEQIEFVGINEECNDQLIIMLAYSLDDLISKHDLSMREEIAQLIWLRRPRNNSTALLASDVEKAPAEEEIYIKRARNDSESTVDLTQDLEIAESPQDAFCKCRRNDDDILRDVAMYCLLIFIFCTPCAIFLIVKYRQ